MTRVVVLRGTSRRRALWDAGTNCQCVCVVQLSVPVRGEGGGRCVDLLGVLAGEGARAILVSRGCEVCAECMRCRRRWL